MDTPGTRELRPRFGAGDRPPSSPFTRILELGAGPRHLELCLRAWLRGEGLGQAAAHRAYPLPAALRRALPGLERDLASILRLRREVPGTRGTARLVFETRRGGILESVLLPREAVCVSVQAGCAVGCLFCKTGEDGFEASLDALEICAQVVHARRRRRVRRVVMMGMGEPLHNLGAVLEALRLLGGPGGFPHKQLTVSTVGSPALFDRCLREPVRPSIALSLHSTYEEKRAFLLPHAPRIPIPELLDRAFDYARRTGWPLQCQWTLLAGWNDGPDEMARLAAHCEGEKVCVNLIPQNPAEGLPFEAPPEGRALECLEILRRRGVFTTLRRSAGTEVSAACGQLRARLRP